MNARRIAVSDLVFAAAGLLALVSTFLPWWQSSISATIGTQTLSASVTVDGWNTYSPSGRDGAANQTITGPLVWIPMLLLLVLGALALARALAAPRLLPGRTLHRACAGVGALCVILVVVRWVTYFTPPRPAGVPEAVVGSGADVGTYLGLLCALATAGLGIRALLQGPAPLAPSGATPYGAGYGQPLQFAQPPQCGQPQQPYAQPQPGPQPYGGPQPPQPPYNPPQHAAQPQGYPPQPPPPQQPYAQPQSGPPRPSHYGGPQPQQPLPPQQWQ